MGLVSKTVDYAFAPADDEILFTTGAAVLAGTLPTAVGIAQKTYLVMKVDAGTGSVLIGTTSGQTIQGQANYKLGNQWQFVILMSDGANWIVWAEGL